VVAAVVARWDDSLHARLGPERSVGRTAVPIDARDAIGRQQESLLGDLVTDAMRAGTGADAAVLNAGTLRLDDVIRPGPLSNYQLESIFLFPDETRVLSVPLTGARLREILEHGVADSSLGKGGFLQVSGVSFSYNPAAPSGSRIQGDVRRNAGRGRYPAGGRAGLSCLRGRGRLRHPRGRARLRGPFCRAARGRPPGALHQRLASRAGHRAADRPNREGWKHKSRLSRMLAGTGGLSSFDHPGRKAEIPGAPKGYVVLPGRSVTILWTDCKSLLHNVTDV